MKVSGSILAIDDHKTAIKDFEKTDIDFLHLDIMDGSYTEKKVDPFIQLKRILKKTEKQLDVHLMATRPKKLIRKYLKLKPSYITIHLDIKQDLPKIISYIKDHNSKVGIAISPRTDIKKVFEYLSEIDLVLIMGVKPGKGGQIMNFATHDLVKELKKEVTEKNLSVMVAVDGGVNNQNAPILKREGVDMLIAGSYITSRSLYQEAINDLR